MSFQQCASLGPFALPNKQKLAVGRRETFSESQTGLTCRKCVLLRTCKLSVGAWYISILDSMRENPNEVSTKLKELMLGGRAMQS